MAERTAKVTLSKGRAAQPQCRCGSCGRRLSKGAKSEVYCPKCGARLDKTPVKDWETDRARAEREKYERRMRGDWT